MSKLIGSNCESVSLKQDLILLAAFFICFFEFSFRVGGTGVTANYFYILFPVIFFMAGIKRRIVIREEVALIVLIYIIIYFLGSPLEILDAGSTESSLFRRFASFVAFLLPLSLAFIEFKPRDIRIFKMAVILACLYYSINKILLFLTLMVGVDVYNLKGAVGSQRYGFILALGFFIALYERRLFFGDFVRSQRTVIALILLTSLFLTFSRATVMAVVGTAIYFVWLKYFSSQDNIDNTRVIKRSGLNKKLKALILLSSLAGLIFAAFYFFGEVGVMKYYKDRFVQPFQFDSVSSMTNVGSSEGFRVHLISRVLEYISWNPVSGSNYQGLYLLYEEFKGAASTHNQYMDVLLRTGIFGAAIWLYLIYRIFRFCKPDRGLLLGFVAILIYGLVHETFKLSYASFVFGILLSFSYINTTGNSAHIFGRYRSRINGAVIQSKV